VQASAQTGAREQTQTFISQQKERGQMDKQKEPGKWAWVPALMPGVTRLMAEKRRDLGPVHVRECWRRGVELGEPGWFFAREGPLAIGTPWPAIADVAGWQATVNQSMVFLRPLEDAHAGT
jgi:hypothetical protein